MLSGLVPILFNAGVTDDGNNTDADDNGHADTSPSTSTSTSTPTLGKLTLI